MKFLLLFAFFCISTFSYANKVKNPVSYNCGTLSFQNGAFRRALNFGTIEKVNVDLFVKGRKLVSDHGAQLEVHNISLGVDCQNGIIFTNRGAVGVGPTGTAAASLFTNQQRRNPKLKMKLFTFLPKVYSLGNRNAFYGVTSENKDFTIYATPDFVTEYKKYNVTTKLLKDIAVVNEGSNKYSVLFVTKDSIDVWGKAQSNPNYEASTYTALRSAIKRFGRYDDIVRLSVGQKSKPTSQANNREIIWQLQGKSCDLYDTGRLARWSQTNRFPQGICGNPYPATYSQKRDFRFSRLYYRQFQGRVEKVEQFFNSEGRQASPNGPGSHTKYFSAPMRLFNHPNVYQTAKDPSGGIDYTLLNFCQVNFKSVGVNWSKVSLLYTDHKGKVSSVSKPIDLKNCEIKLRTEKDGIYRFRGTLKTDSGYQLTKIDTNFEVKNLWVVALGDSYSAGEGAPDGRSRSNPHWLWERCHQSTKSWTFRTAEKFAAIAKEKFGAWTDFSFLSCSGAKIADNPKKSFVRPASADFPYVDQMQLLVEAVRLKKRAPDVIIWTYGGNDAHFAHLIIECANPLVGCDYDKFTSARHKDSYAYKARQMVTSGELVNLFKRAFDNLNDMYVRNKLNSSKTLVLQPNYFPVTMVKQPDGRLLHKTCYSKDRLQCDLSGGITADIEKSIGIAGGEVAFGRAQNLVATPLTNVISNRLHNRFYDYQKHSFQMKILNQHARSFSENGMCADDHLVNKVCDSVRWQGDHFGAFHPNEDGFETMFSKNENVFENYFEDTEYGSRAKLSPRKYFFPL